MSALKPGPLHDGRWGCADCHIDTQLEYYMLENQTWQRVAKSDEKLCIGCLENRLKRVLTPEDFMDAPINLPYVFGNKSARLLDRLGHRVEATREEDFLKNR